MREDMMMLFRRLSRAIGSALHGNVKKTRRRAALAGLALTMVVPVPQSPAQQSAEGLNLALPTDNDALFRGGGPEFYQYIIRDFKGVESKPWQGGRYGFVRNPVETSNGLLYTRFHEGIDIRPVRRDASGEPLDDVRAIAAGTVVYANRSPHFSSYGNYVVVEHRWDNASYYSLYAHLASIDVQTGTKLERGARLGRLGYTGDGIDRERAHVHLELNLMLSRRFESWYDHFIKTDPNRHGIYNGTNLTGIDIAGLYQALRKRPSLTIAQFLAEEETFYRVTLPASPNFELPNRYPWLLRRAAGPVVPAWEVSFNRSGVPVEVRAAETAVSMPTLSYVKKGGGNYADLTRGVIGGSGENARLTETGMRLMRLLVWPE
jgi:murein DD-endopeptidase MepM/ murein hydrolase activator NlpD